MAAAWNGAAPGEKNEGCTLRRSALELTRFVDLSLARMLRLFFL